MRPRNVQSHVRCLVIVGITFRISFIASVLLPRPLHSTAHTTFEENCAFRFNLKTLSLFYSLVTLIRLVHFHSCFDYSQIELNPKLFDLNPQPNTPPPPLNRAQRPTIYRSRNDANPATKHTLTPSIPLMATAPAHHRRPRPCIWRMRCCSASSRIQLVTWADRVCRRAAIATASSRYYRWISA